MATISVIDLINTTHSGPQAAGPNGAQQAVFLRQGDADGACGPYSLLMALLICGLIDRDKIDYLTRLDRRTSYGKLMDQLDKHPGLFRDGVSLDDLVSVIENLFTNRLNLDQNTTTGAEVRSFIQQHIEAGHPVITNIAFSGGAHALVVVGIEYGADGTARRLLLLDPGGSRPQACSWNGVIECRGQGGIYPYTYWWPGDTQLTRVRFDAALALWPGNP